MQAQSALQSRFSIANRPASSDFRQLLGSYWDRITDKCIQLYTSLQLFNASLTFWS